MVSYMGIYNTGETENQSIGVGFIHRGLNLMFLLYIVGRAHAIQSVVQLTKWT